MKLVHISRKNEESTRSANSPSNEDDTTVTKEDSSAVDELQTRVIVKIPHLTVLWQLKKT